MDVALVGRETVLTSAGTIVSTSQTIYNDKGQVERTIGPDGRITDFEYDDLNRQTAVINHPVTIDGVVVRHRVETEYDERGQVRLERTNVRQLADGTIDRTQARETVFEYDAFGRQTRTTFADGTSVSTTYDGMGRVVSETNQMNLTRTLEYDLDGRLAGAELPAIADPQNGDAPTNPRYVYRYDERGRLVGIRDPLYGHSVADPTSQRETRFTFDERGNQLTRELPAGEMEHSTYNDLGQQTLHVSFEGVVTAFVYDNAVGGGGRLVEKRFFPDEAAYNAFLVDQVANPPAETISYVHDALGRQVQVVQDDGTTARTTSTGYDAEGRVVSINSPEGLLRYEYDALGRKIRTYTLDPADPQNVTNDFRYKYDALGRLQTVEVWERDNVLVDASDDPGQQPETTRYGYDLVGTLDRTDLPTGVVTDYEYDELNRLETLTHFAPDGTPEDLSNNQRLAELQYTLRSDGRRASAIETFWWDDNADSILDPHQNTLAWSYDELGRLTDEVFASYDDLLEYSDHFTHDLTGNRLGKTRNWTAASKPDEAVTYDYDASDRLISEELETTGDSQPEAVTTYGYTGMQQASRDVTVGGVLSRRETYDYDLQGRMAVVTIQTHQGGAVQRVERTTYEYDSTSIRVSAFHEVDADADAVFEAATKTEYLNDPQNFTGYAQVLQETELNPSTGEVLKRTVYTIGPDVISQMVTEYTGGVPGAPTSSFFGYDGHGSTRVLFNVAGAIATILGVRQVFHYDAYGNLLNLSSPALAATALLYSGEFLDAATGQQYLRARWYNPLTGRFNRLDPFFGNVQDPQSLHKYLYTHADPINSTDPSGMFGSVQGLAAAKIGVTVGAIGGFTVGTIYGAIKTRTVLGALTYGIFGALIGGTLGGLNAYLLASWAPAWAAATNVSLQAAYFEVGMMLAIPQKIAGSISLATAIVSRDPVDIVFGGLGFGGSFVITVLPTTRTFRYRFVGAKNVQVRTAGAQETEIDQVRLMTITEYKDGRGLANPLNQQSPQQWAQENIYDAAANRIAVIENAVDAFITEQGSGYTPSVQTLQRIRNHHFAIQYDEPNFRNAVNVEVERLAHDYPDWRFSVDFGAPAEGQQP